MKEDTHKIRCSCGKVIAEVEGITCRHCKTFTPWEKLKKKIKSVKPIVK